MRCTIKTSYFTGPAYWGSAPPAEADPSTGRRPDHSQGASANHPRGSMVPVEDKAARTAVNTLGKRLGSDRLASRTLPRGAVGVHRDRVPTSVRCFVGDEPQEQGPGGIGDGLGE